MMGNLLYVLSWLLVLLVGPFVIWRRIRDEYNDEDIVRLLLILVFFGLLGAKIFGILGWIAQSGWQQEMNWWMNSGLDIWGGVMVGMAGMWWYHLDRARGLTGDVEDAIAEGYWWVLVIFALKRGLIGLLSRDWISLVWMLIWIVGLVVFYWVRGKYRQFSWYPSGKVGFVFWSSMILLGLGYSVWAFMSGNTLLGFGRFVFGVGTVVLGLIGGYRRSGRKVRKDFGWLGVKA